MLKRIHHRFKSEGSLGDQLPQQQWRAAFDSISMKSCRDEKGKSMDANAYANTSISGFSCRPSRYLRPLGHGQEDFPTGSSYYGQWGELSMTGIGEYTLPNGVIYTGGFFDGRFEGIGKLQYPNGTDITGTWVKGVLKGKPIISFGDGLHYEKDNWGYCKDGNRMFACEVNSGLQPPGATLLTNAQPTPVLPPGHYDTVDGCYDPKKNVIVDWENPNKVIRVPTNGPWIRKHCRKAWDEVVGPKPAMYKSWSRPNEIATDYPKTNKSEENVSVLLKNKLMVFS